MRDSDRRRRQAASKHGRQILLALAALAALAVILTPSGSASVSTIKVYDVALSSTGTGCPSDGNSCFPGAAVAPVTFSITNDPVSQTTLGSVNLDAPVLLPVDTNLAYAPTTSVGTVALVSKSGTGGELQIRNLNLTTTSPPVTVTFYVDTPCAVAPGQAWNVYAKQSNQFNGSGNDFTLGTSSGLASDVAPGGCHVAFYNQPTDTKVGGTITDVAGSAGGPIKVGLYNSSNQLLTSCPVASCTATISVNTYSTNAGSLSGGGPVNFAYDGGAGGLIAAFPSLSISGVSNFPDSFTLLASGLNTTAVSNSFDIVYDTANCTANGCTLGSFNNPDTLGNGAIYITTSTGFTFLELNPSSVPGAVTAPGQGCAYFVGTGAGGFAESDGRTDPGANMTVTYYVPQKLIKARYGQNVGQQYIPICAGAMPVVGISPTPCYLTSTQGWVDDTLDSNGLFTGGQSTAVCAPDGYFWGIVPSFQDKVPSGGPVTTGWNSVTINGTGYRYFVMSVPSGWDYKGGG